MLSFTFSTIRPEARSCLRPNVSSPLRRALIATASGNNKRASLRIAIGTRNCDTVRQDIICAMKDVRGYKLRTRLTGDRRAIHAWVERSR